MNDNVEQWAQAWTIWLTVMIILGVVIGIYINETAHFNELKSACVEQKK